MEQTIRKFGGGQGAWGLYAALGLLATAIYFLPFAPLRSVLHDGVALSAMAMVVAGARRSAHPLGWYLLACGLLSLTTGDLLRTLHEDFLDFPISSPSIADGFHLAGYLLLAAGLARMARAGAPWRDDTGLIDATIVTTSVGLPVWVFFVSPYLGVSRIPFFEVAVTVAYPLAGVLLLGAAARLMFGGGARTPAYYLLLFGVLAMLVSDGVYTVMTMAGTDGGGETIEAGWLISYVAFGAAALHPSMPFLTEPAPRREPRVSWQRLALLISASLTAPTVLLVQDVRGEDLNVPVIFACSVALFLLVLFRMSALAAELYRHRGEARFRSLVQNASDAIMVLDADGTVRYASPSARRVTGHAEEDLLGEDGFGQVHPDDAVAARRFLAESLKSPGVGPALDLRYVQADGSSRHLEAVAANLLDDPNVGGVVLTTRDITERKELEERLRHQAVHDALTNLPNRALFMDRLQHALDRSARYLISTAVLFLDLDNFKVVNDSLGHKSGDELLISVAKRLESCLRTGDTVARLGGDEFTILLEDVAGPDEAVAVANRIRDELKAPIRLHGQEVFITTSVGISMSTSGNGSPEEMLRDADAAMYEAKARGKGHFEVFNPDMNDRLLDRLQLESEMHRALREEEFRLYYQPSVFLEDGTVTGFEALVRWEHPMRGILSPAEFIPIAEDSGLIVPMGAWILHEACRQTREWQRMRPPDSPLLTISVNLSARQFQQPTLHQEVVDVLRETGLDPASLILEITETVAMDDSSFSHNVLGRLKDLGIKLAVDDFGTGYSSLSYLQDFPIEVLKIDRSFVDRMASDPKSASIVSTMISFAHSLGLSVTAEGIETAEQLARLKELGCLLGQGYHLGYPLPSHEAQELIAPKSLKYG